MQHEFIYDRGSLFVHSAYMFTGKERDIESGNDYFGARYYSSSMGRFSSPDPSGLMYADPTNPQSLNLYSYVLNNPLTGTDPTGMAYCQWDDGSHDDSANTGVDGAVNSGTDCTNAGGTWSHADGLNDDGSQMGSEQAPSLTVTATLNTSTDSTSVSTTGESYDPDDANIYLLSVGITEDSQHSFGCIAQAYGIAGAGNATGVAVGRPTVAKRFADWGSSQGTSQLSKGLSDLANSKVARQLGVKPGSYRSPTGGLMADGQPFVMRSTSNLGRAAARWAPWVISTATTAYSSYQLWNCLGK